jgi:hypothetical protein
MRLSPLLLAACLAVPGRAAGEPVDYLRDVKPILKERCYACHGPLKQRAKLRLDTADLMREGGRSGPAVLPEDPEGGPLVERVGSADPSRRMPPEGKPLTPEQVALLTAWVREGAKAPPAERPEEDPRRHWAYLPPARPAVPAVRNASWVRNPIDAFIAAGHERLGLTPAPEADRATLLRRVTLDLTGLPPTREELHAFLSDPSPDAYESVVERLLADPRHAERWARHWMDVWRYSDWYGSRGLNELRYSRRHIWRWRDWIIDSLEQDRGYDRMVTEMLAADELAPGDADARRASGFLGRNFYVFNRHVWLQETVEYVGTGLLAITFKCCRCHDHKYDPISQEDYYRFRAFFEPHRVRTDAIPGKTNPLKGNIATGSPPGSELEEGLDCVYDAEPSAVTYLLERGNEKNPVKDHPLLPGLPSFLGGVRLRVEPVELPLDAFYPGLRAEMRDHLLAEARTAVRVAEGERARSRDAVREKGLEAARARLAALLARIDVEMGKYEYTQPSDPRLQGMAAAAARAERTAELRQVDYELLRAEQEQAAGAAGSAAAALTKKVADLRARRAGLEKAAPATSPTPFGPVYPRTSSGRRLALARWVTARDNPLAARVAVNHVWLRHLGSALVPTPHNFGLNGKRPTHPELLDWLAVEFMERGWSMKHLHRLIVTSSTYRMESGRAKPQAADPENRSLWRANVRRMEAEVVRDGLLHLAGRLDLARGGPDLDPTTDHAVRRRSLYFRHTADEKALLLDIFDGANASECFERTESIVPQQALALANNDFSHSQARLIARKLGGEAADAAFVTAAFEHVLGRQPLSDERAKCEGFLARHAALLAEGKALTPASDAGAPSAVPPSPDPRARARENLVHVLLNYNEFVTIR